VYSGVRRRGVPDSYRLAGPAEAGASLDVAPFDDRAPGPGRDPARRGHRRPRRGHARRFTSFSLVGAAIFGGGLALQAFLTSGLHIGSLTSYLVQAVASVEASFLLNRRLTWRETAGWWPSFARFNLQKAITVTANLLLYAGLVNLGLNYLIANVALTAAFTIVNYVAADRFAFAPAAPGAVGRDTGPLPVLHELLPLGSAGDRDEPQLASWRQRAARELPSVSVIIPVRGSETTIRASVDSVLGQDYPGVRQLILVGSPGDTTWSGLEGVSDPRLAVVETRTPPGIRDANFKRDLGIRQTSGDLVLLVDSDMVLPANWMSKAVRLLADNQVDCVAGTMRSIRDDFWGRFVDRNLLSAKTPRVREDYVVTAREFGAAGRKPPITADALFTREMYEKCPIDPVWVHGSLEDYEWFWRVVSGGHRVLVSGELYGWHHHRAGLGALNSEYRRSARGCAYFVRAHREAPFARKRLAQAVLLPVLAVLLIAGLGLAAALGDGRLTALTVLALAGGCGLVLSAREFARTRTLESLLYPLPALVLGTAYTVSLATHLLRSTSMHALTVPRRPVPPEAAGAERRPWRPQLAGTWHPLTFILAFQAAVALFLVWNNTGFSDEDDYLWVGSSLIGNVLHGTAWPSTYAHTGISGFPFFYPPLGAVANMIGGLAGARLLSLLFMLCSTGFVYCAAKRLYGRGSALCAAGLWVTFSPALQLGAFATFDAMSVCLTACAAWLVVRTGRSSKRAELIVCSAVVLAVAEMTAYSGIVMIPVVVVFALLVWAPVLGARQAAACAAWFAGLTIAAFAIGMTASRCWPGLLNTVLTRQVSTQQYASVAHVFSDSWTYGGFIAILAVIGAVYALSSGSRLAGTQTVYLAAVALVIPVAQAHDGTAVSLRKHLAYGGIFAVMAAGYGITRFAGSLPARRWAMLTCCAAAFAIPLSNGVMQADNWYRSWQDASSLDAALAPLLPTHPSMAVSLTDGNYLCRYDYAQLGNVWEECLRGLTAADVRKARTAYIILGYPGSVAASDSSLENRLQAPGTRQQKSANLRGVEKALANEPGDPQLAQLTTVLEKSKRYRLVTLGSYNDAQTAALYSLWKRVPVPATASPAATKKAHSAATKKHGAGRG